VFPAKRENIHLRCPRGDLNRIHRLETRHSNFQNPPQKVKTIVRFDTHGKECRFHQRFFLREKMREHIHPGRCDSRITSRAQTRGAETFIAESQTDGVKRHKWKKVSYRNLLEAIIEFDHGGDIQVEQTREDREGLLRIYSTTGPEK